MIKNKREEERTMWKGKPIQIEIYYYTKQKSFGVCLFCLIWLFYPLSFFGGKGVVVFQASLLCHPSQSHQQQKNNTHQRTSQKKDFVQISVALKNGNIWQFGRFCCTSVNIVLGGHPWTDFWEKKDFFRPPKICVNVFFALQQHQSKHSVLQRFHKPKYWFYRVFGCAQPAKRIAASNTSNTLLKSHCKQNRRAQRHTVHLQKAQICARKCAPNATTFLLKPLHW